MRLTIPGHLALLLLLGLLCASTATVAEYPPAWTGFRGPTSDGHAAQAEGTTTKPPTHWSETENVAWKTDLPHKGWSTPVVMNDQIWLTTATEGGNDFYALGIDAKSGVIFFNEKLFHCETPDPLGNAVNSYASPSPAIEPGRVFVHFGRYGTACIDTTTRKVLWKRDDLPCNHYRGPGSSAFLFEDLLILTFDGSDLQYTAALDTQTGKTAWKTDRSTEWKDFDENGVIIREGDMRKAFATPLLYERDGQPILLSLGSSALFGYNPHTGAELWKMPNPGYGPGVSPVMDGNLAILQVGYGPSLLRAIRLDGKGDLTDDYEAWRMEGKQIPHTPTPIIIDGLLYMVSDRGLLTSLELETGVEVWTERIGGNYLASPIYVDGKVYLCSNQGKYTVFKPGRTYQHIATNTLDDGLMASPVPYGNALILRTTTHLYRIEE